MMSKMILWWVLIIAGIVALVKWLMDQSHSAIDACLSEVKGYNLVLNYGEAEIF